MPRPVPHTGPYDADFDDPLFDVDVAGYAPDDQERSDALLSHLSGFAGLVVPFGSLLGPALMLMLKRDGSAYVEDQAREAVNFQVSVFLAALLFTALSFVLIGIPFLVATGVAWVVLPIKAALAANRGERYRYPFTARLIK